METTEDLRHTVHTVVEQAIREQVHMDELGLDRIGPDASIVDDLGLDSVDLLTAVYDIEVALKVKLPIGEWLGGAEDRAALTVAALVTHIVEILQQAPAVETQHA